MDYKYIEQLLERYWNCETSLEEEQILRSFFHQKEIPAHLLRYKAMFAYQEIEKERGLTWQVYAAQRSEVFRWKMQIKWRIWLRFYKQSCNLRRLLGQGYFHKDRRRYSNVLLV